MFSVICYLHHPPGFCFPWLSNRGGPTHNKTEARFPRPANNSTTSSQVFSRFVFSSYLPTLSLRIPAGLTVEQQVFNHQSTLSNSVNDSTPASRILSPIYVSDGLLGEARPSPSVHPHGAFSECRGSPPQVSLVQKSSFPTVG